MNLMKLVFPLALALFGTIILIPPQQVFSQTTDQIIVTWEANNFYPTDFKGKPVASPGSQVSVSIEIIRGGKLLNVNSANIAWYLDNDFLSEGIGKKSVAFKAKKKDNGKHVLRAQVERGDEAIETSVQIPVATPRVVIEVPYPNGLVQAQSEIVLRLVPYFFNNISLSDLKFFWQINDAHQQSANDNQLLLKLGSPQTASQRTLRITGTVQNERNLAEFANGRAKLIVQ